MTTPLDASVPAARAEPSAPADSAASAALDHPSAAPSGTPATSPSGGVGASLELRDIHLPAEPGLWPPAPGWWLLLVVLLAALAFLGRQGWRMQRRRRRRQRVLAELDRLEAAEMRGPALVAAVSALLKRVALSRYPRAEVAALSGDAWLAFLDRSGGEGRFATGAGRALAEGAYAPETTGLDAHALLSVARDWLRRNLR
jgi:HAMP domain-containing protein